jgi:hypothetical protein
MAQWQPQWGRHLRRMPRRYVWIIWGALLVIVAAAVLIVVLAS